MCADVIRALSTYGTVSNLVPEDQRDVVQDIRNERTALMGVGGARVLATETGEAGVFGKSREVLIPSARFRFRWSSRYSVCYYGATVVTICTAPNI